MVYTTLIRHRKLIVFSHHLGVSRNEAIGMLVCLWSECGTLAQDGDLSDYASAQVAAVCGWPLDDAARLVEALVEAGFLDRDRRGRLRVHDWLDYTGRAVYVRQMTAARVARYRQRHGTGNDNVRVRNAPVRVTNATEYRLEYKTRERLDKSKKRLESKDSQRPPTTQTQTQTLFHSSQTPDQNHHQADGQDLNQIYHERTGLPAHAGTRVYLDKLAVKYGSAEVEAALVEHGPRVAEASNGLRYLSGILDAQRREGRRPIGMVPPADGATYRAPPDRSIVACAGGCGTKIVPLVNDPELIYCSRCQIEGGEL